MMKLKANILIIFEKQCENLKNDCELGITDNFINKEFFDKMKIFLNLLPKFDLYNFLYMKECFLTHLLSISSNLTLEIPKDKKKGERSNQNTAKVTSPKKII